MNRQWSLVYCIICLAAMAACLGSCASGGTNRTASPQGEGLSPLAGEATELTPPAIAPSLGSMLPGLPDEAGEALAGEHAGSTIYPLKLSAADTFDQGAGAVGSGTQLLFSENLQNWRWAIYRFSDAGLSGLPRLLSIKSSQSKATTIYVGMPDYDAGRWSFHAINSPSGFDALQIPQAGSISPAGHFYCAVFAAPSQYLELEYLRLDADMALPPPQNLQASWGSAVNAVELGWDSPAETYASDPDFNYGFVQIDRADSAGGPWTFLDLVPKGTFEYADDGNKLSLLPATVYWYRVRCCQGGIKGWPGEPRVGRSGAAITPVIIAVQDHGSGQQEIMFDATRSSSNDPEAALSFEWDFDNDFVGDSTEPLLTQELNFLNDIWVSLRVTDAYGVTAQVAKKLPVYPWADLSGDDPDESDPADSVEFVAGDGPTYTWRVTLRYRIAFGVSPYVVELDPNYDGTLGPAILPVGTFISAGDKVNVVNITALPGEYYFAIRTIDGSFDGVPGGSDTSIYIWPDKVKLEAP